MGGRRKLGVSHALSIGAMVLGSGGFMGYYSGSMGEMGRKGSVCEEDSENQRTRQKRETKPSTDGKEQGKDGVQRNESREKLNGIPAVLRTNKDIKLEQSHFRVAREYMSDAFVAVVNRYATKDSAVNYLSDVTEESLKKNTQLNSRILSLVLNLAGGDECKICEEDDFIDAVGNLARNDTIAAIIAERSTRYGKRILLNLAFTHHRNPALGNALQKLAVNNNENCHFGPANLVSLVSLASTTEIAECYREFAFWALNKTLDSQSQSPTYKLKKVYLGDDRIAKTRQTLGQNEVVWKALQQSRSSPLHTQIQAARLFSSLTGESNANLTDVWTLERLRLLQSWLVSPHRTLQKPALESIASLSTNDVLRKRMLNMGILDNIYDLMRDQSSRELAQPLLMALEKLITPIALHGYILDDMSLSHFKNIHASETLPKDEYSGSDIEHYEHVPGWIQLISEFLHRDEFVVKQLGVMCLDSMVTHGRYKRMVLQEWLVSVVECLVKKKPEFETAYGFTRAKSRALGVDKVKSDALSDLREITVNIAALKAIAFLCTHEGIPAEFVSCGGDKLLELLSRSQEIGIKHQLARILSNVFARDGVPDMVFTALCTPYWKKLLLEWQASPDMKLHSQSTRALINMGFIQVDRNNVRYIDGVNPIYDSSLNSRGDKNSIDGLAVDVVFIHGLLGGSFASWVTDSFDFETGANIPASSVWPATWLPSDLEKEGIHSRILSVGYEANIFAASAPWYALTIPERSRLMLSKLIRAGVGTRPTVFITHSMGGIILKEIMLLASMSDNVQERRMFQNTQIAVFYGVPHHGSPVAILGSNAFSKTFLGPHPAVKDLHGTPHLKMLNDQFGHFAHIHKLSLAEDLSSSLPLLGLNAVVVPLASADPGWGQFKKLKGSDHINICKPSDPTDPRYAETKMFVIQALKTVATDKGVIKQ